MCHGRWRNDSDNDDVGDIDGDGVVDMIMRLKEIS